jgi:hypothetical protein
MKLWRDFMNNTTRFMKLMILCIIPLAGCQSPKPASEAMPVTASNLKAADIFANDSDVPAKIGSGWHPLQTDSGKFYRWAEQDPEIIIEPASGTQAKIAVYLGSFYKNRRCDLALNAKKIASKEIAKEKVESFEFIAPLVKGPNVLKISSPDKCQIPAEIPELSNSDKRCLSFVFWSVSIKKVG